MYWRKQHGFTFIEMIIVMVIMGIILSMIVPVLTQGLNDFNTGENIFNANWQGRIAMERMSRDVLSVRSAADISTMTSTNFSFTDTGNNTISYALSGTTLTLTLNGNTAILADGVQTLTFNYFDATGAATSSSATVHLIQVSINVIQNSVNYTLTTSIYPRNLT